MKTIQFISNKDNKTCTFLVDNWIEKDEVIYNKFLDLRGLYLYLYAKDNYLLFNDFKFMNSDSSEDLSYDEISIIFKHFEYLKNPTYLNIELDKRLKYKENKR